MKKFKFLVITSFSFILFAVSCTAHAQTPVYITTTGSAAPLSQTSSGASSLQMLPPTQPGSTTTCTPTAGQSQFLTYSGSNYSTGSAINCVSGITVTSGGDVTITGSGAAGTNALTVSNSVNVNGSIATNGTINAANALVGAIAQCAAQGGGTIKVDGSGNLSCSSASTFGGLYELVTTANGGFIRCGAVNPYTGGCSCPSGFTAHPAHWNNTGGANDQYNTYQCTNP